MSGITGVELGPDRCVLVRAARHGARTTVASVRTIGPGELSGDPAARTEALRDIRQHERFPARTRVVQWRTADVSPGAAFQSALLRSLADAGFEIQDTQTPGQALAQLVRDRRLDADGKVVAAVALNTHGAVIAIVSDGAVISSRTFTWSLGTPFAGSRPERLERYLVISQLAPQLQHAMELVRPVYGAHVASVALCGNLPNLRSLSMLLIEELDIEVETLDSADILGGDGSELAESAAALQLAVAASVADGSRPMWTRQAHESSSIPRPSSYSGPAIGVLAFALATAWTFAQVSGSSRAVPILPDGVATVAAAPATPDLRPEATMGRVPSAAPPPLVRSAPDPVAEPPPPPAPAPLPPSPPEEIAPPAQPEVPVRPMIAAPAPLPRVDGVMVGAVRRLAIVGGSVVGVGDSLGVRTIVRIERDGIVLREPSGQEVFIPVRGSSRPAVRERL